MTNFISVEMLITVFNTFLPSERIKENFRRILQNILGTTMGMWDIIITWNSLSSGLKELLYSLMQLAAVLKIILRSWKDPHGSASSMSSSGCYVFLSCVLPYSPFQLPSHSVHRNVGSDNLWYRQEFPAAWHRPEGAGGIEQYTEKGKPQA